MPRGCHSELQHPLRRLEKLWLKGGGEGPGKLSTPRSTAGALVTQDGEMWVASALSQRSLPESPQLSLQREEHTGPGKHLGHWWAGPPCGGLTGLVLRLGQVAPRRGGAQASVPSLRQTSWTRPVWGAHRGGLEGRGSSKEPITPHRSLQAGSLGV